MPYLGKSPSQGVRTRFQFTPNAGTTSISGADANGLTLSFTDGNYVDVYLNGVMLKAGVDYNTNTANTIAGLSATVASDVVDIVVYDTFSLFGGTLEGNVKVNNGTFNVTGAGDFDSTLNVDGVVTANAGVVVDNITIDGTEIDLSSGNLTIDVANDIILDSGDGDIQLKDTGSTFLNIYESSDHAYLYNPRSNGDIIFQGNGVSEALRLDMSASGAATFNGTITGTTATLVGANTLTLRNDTNTDANEPKLIFDNDTFSGANYANITTGNGGLLLKIESPSTSTFQNRHQIIMNGGAGDDIQFNLSTDNGSNYVNYFKIDGGNATFNETGAAKDFRIESDNSTHMLFLDGSADAVGIRKSDPSFGLDVGVPMRVTTADNNAQLVLQSTDTDANEGPILVLQRDAGNVPSDDDVMGTIKFQNDDTGLNMTTYAKIDTSIRDTSNGSEAARLNFYVQSGGSETKLLGLIGASASAGAEVTFNEDSNDIDFRIESDASATMFQVDASLNRIFMGTGTNANFNATVAVIRNDTASLGDFEGNLLLFDNSTSNNATNGGHIVFAGHDGSSERGYAKIIGGKGNSTSGEYDGQLMFKVRDHGDSSIDEKLRIKSNESVFNEVSANHDFRIESDSDTQIFFVDAGNNAVGIKENDPSGYPSNTQTGDTSGIFRIAGSVGSIAVSSTGNEIAFTRDGLNYISSPGTSSKINLRASTTGGVSLHAGASSFSAVSDETFKTITGNIENASDKVKTLRTVMGRYNDEDESASHPFLIAQDIQKVLPEAVIFDKDLNKLLLSYTDVIPLLTASLKEALSKIETLEIKIAKLEGD
jgi:hypothetical protein